MSDPLTAPSAQPPSEIEAEVAACRELRQRLESEVPPLATSLAWTGRRTPRWITPEGGADVSAAWAVPGAGDPPPREPG